MKKYWLTMHPDTFIWVKNGMLCVYDAESGIFHKDSFSVELEKIVDELLEIDNLYTAMVTDKDFEIPSVGCWIRKLVESGCCDWVPNDGEYQKPVSLKPILKVTDDMKYYKECHSKGRNVNLLSNLHRLVIYLNRSEFGNDIYARQCVYPFRKQEELNWGKLYGFIGSSGESIAFSEIVFVGSLWKYKEYNKLQEFLSRLSVKVSVYCTEQDYDDYIVGEEIPGLPEEYKVCILKDQYPEDDPVFRQLVGRENLTWHFILTSEENYMAASVLLEKYKLVSCRLLPVYTGHNRRFFEEFVYTTEDEILDYKPSKREIFVNQTLNSNFFGTLQILPGGEVSGGNKVIGNFTDSLYEVVYREMTEGDSWFHIRKEEPCCSCCYQWLCPAPSYYEHVLEKTNLCNVVE